ncbi:hypothetical protein [Halopenitus malekzadehii]|nr:hypothetical protein [Halopenitus malekzadehii]
MSDDRTALRTTVGNCHSRADAGTDHRSGPSIRADRTTETDPQRDRVGG